MSEEKCKYLKNGKYCPHEIESEHYRMYHTNISSNSNISSISNETNLFENVKSSSYRKPDFSVISFNVLANCYLNLITMMDLKWSVRKKQIVSILKGDTGKGYDVICLQEVDEKFIIDSFRTTHHILLHNPYKEKSPRKDYIVTMVKKSVFDISEFGCYHGFLNEDCLVVCVLHKKTNEFLRIYNCDLIEKKIDLKRMRFRGILGGLSTKKGASILCGDLDSRPGSQIYKDCRKMNLKNSVDDNKDFFSSSFDYTKQTDNGGKRVDYIWFDDNLRLVSSTKSKLKVQIIPSKIYPSDHVPLVSNFSFGNQN